MRWLCLVLTLALGPALAAQQPHPAPTAERRAAGRGLPHYGKWLGAALAVTFTALAAREHSSSDRAFSQLLTMCRTNATDCRRNPDGTYTNPATEQLYQTSLRFDRRAQARLFAAQASALLTAALFLADHNRRPGGPDNIPLHGLAVAWERDGARVGVRVKF
jgi:hypothetical protein